MGCGNGRIGRLVAPFAKEYLGLDLSDSVYAFPNYLQTQNITLAQASGTNLPVKNEVGDVTICWGVLHHMDDPMAGWKVLTDCLKPGGLVKIGLYSELARKNIVKIRKEIRQLDIGSSDLEMKSFRDMLMKSDEDHHKAILTSIDFYSLSELKDLLFHVQEHRFTIPQIKDHLDKLGLKFCGFETQNVVSHFQKTNKNKYEAYDLDKWQVYEEANPQAFAGMYQFWCQKVD